MHNKALKRCTTTITAENTLVARRVPNGSRGALAQKRITTHLATHLEITTTWTITTY